jgi:hypothetical protein
MRVGIVGGGLAGSLAAVVLRSRSPSASITVLDAGRRGIGGRLSGGQLPDSGAAFLRCTSAARSQLASVLSQLEEVGILGRWDARFGLLGNAGGGFLPRQVLAKTSVAQMMKQEAPGASNMGGNMGGVDFCGLLGGGDAPFYVGMPTNSFICDGICRLAGAEIKLGTKVVSAHHLGAKGGWELQLLSQSGKPSASDPSSTGSEVFDALVIATHDPILAAQAVRSIGIEGAHTAETGAQEQQHLHALADALGAQHAVPVFCWSGVFPPGTSAHLPFDAVSVPASRIVQFLARAASKPGRPALNDGGELWTAISTPAFAAELLRHKGAGAMTQPGDSDKGGSVALAATGLMAVEISALFAQHMPGGAGPKPLRASSKRWGAGFAAGSLQHVHDCIALPAWQLAVAGDFVQERHSPLEAAALSGLAAGESLAQVIADA